MIPSSFLSLPGLNPNGMFTEISPMAGTQIFPVAVGWNTEIFPVGWNTEMVSVNWNTEMFPMDLNTVTAMFPVGWNKKNVPCGLEHRNVSCGLEHKNVPYRIGSWNTKKFPVSFK